MNAKSILNDFALEVVVAMVLQARSEGQKDAHISISLGCPVDGDEVDQYMGILNLLKTQKIIKKLRRKTRTGFIVDDDGLNHEMVFYEPSFSLNFNALEKFLVSTSHLPMYSLEMDAKRRLILNKKYILCKLQFNSPNFFFVDHCLKSGGAIITKGVIEKASGNSVPRFHAVLRNLKIAPLFTNIFFPNVASDAVQFRNNLKLNDLVGVKINQQKIKNFLKTCPKI